MSSVSAPPTGEGYFRALFEACGEAFVVTDEQGRAIDCNDAALELLACRRSDLLGTTPLDWSPDVQANGRRSDDWAAEIFARAAAGETLAFEWTHRRLDGNTLIVHVTIRHAVIDGRACHVVVNRNVSDRRLAQDALREERRLRDAIQDAIPGIAYALDIEGFFRFWNRGFEIASGRSADELAHCNALDLFDGADRTHIAERIRDVFALGNSDAEAELIAKDGSRTPYHFTGRRIELGGEELLVGAGMDITERRLAEQALRASERRFSQLIQNSYDTIVILDAKGIQRYVSPSAERVHGYSPAELVDIPVIEQMIHPDDRARVEEAFRQIVETGSGGTQYRHRRKAGGWVHLESYGTNQLANPDIRGVVVNVRDITSLKKAESMYRTLFDEMLNGFAAHEIICDAAGRPVDYRFLSVNPAFERMTGFRAEEVVGRTAMELMPELEPHWLDIYGRVALGGEPAHFENFSAELDKHFEVTAFQPLPGQFACLFQDITERKRAEKKIHALAFYDQLTGLPNRILLMDRLALAMAAAERGDTYGALLFIDLDNFKMLNDTRGHEVGDLLLKEVAERLRANVRAEDTAVRQGGDEFVVLLSGLGKVETEAAQTAEGIANKLLGDLNNPYHIGGLAHHSTASIGVTLFNGRTTSIDELMKQADLAMYRAKAAGRNAVRFFDPALGAAVKARADLEADLRRAIAAQQFVLHYQPQVQGDGRVTGAEALVRWQHPQRGVVAPSDFIPLAEETDLILPLGQWVLESACAQLADWSREPRLAGLSIAVNVSAKQFLQPEFVEQVFAAVSRSGANPRRLKLELTESLLLHDIERTIDKMHRLKERGIGFSLDDFGTGYSSLAYLKRLPLDQLKIDQSFVRDVLSDPNDAAIARTIVALGQSLGLAVIAEGVETGEQRDFLAGIGCQAYQGYLFSRPVAVAALERWLRSC
jgi:diguanylate cyclase (GGDEF)-like protein/PAS domain S-box-containing protein